MPNGNEPTDEVRDLEQHRMANDTPPKDAPRIGTFVPGGYPDEPEPQGILRLQFRDVEAARRLAKSAADAVKILESGRGAAYTHFSLGTFWAAEDTYASDTELMIERLAERAGAERHTATYAAALREAANIGEKRIPESNLAALFRLAADRAEARAEIAARTQTPEHLVAELTPNNVRLRVERGLGGPLGDVVVSLDLRDATRSRGYRLAAKACGDTLATCLRGLADVIEGKVDGERLDTELY